MPEKALLNLSPEPQHKFDLFPEENKPEDLRAEYKINPDCQIVLRNKIWYIDDYPMREWLEEREKAARENHVIDLRLLIKKQKSGWQESLHA